MTIKDRYFLSSEDFKAEFDEVGYRRREIGKRAHEYAESLGGTGVVQGYRGEIVGVAFDQHPGAGWRKNGERLDGGGKFYRPLLSTKAGKEISSKLREFRLPCIDDYLEPVGLSGHMRMGDAEYGRGIPLLKPYFEDLAGEMVLIVPDYIDGDDRYQGHEMLTEISYADYLELKAKDERAKEAA